MKLQLIGALVAASFLAGCSTSGSVNQPNTDLPQDLMPQLPTSDVPDNTFPEYPELEPEFPPAPCNADCDQPPSFILGDNQANYSLIKAEGTDLEMWYVHSGDGSYLGRIHYDSHLDKLVLTSGALGKVHVFENTEVKRWSDGSISHLEFTNPNTGEIVGSWSKDEGFSRSGGKELTQEQRQHLQEKARNLSQEQRQQIKQAIKDRVGRG
ncbi:hypothetical protein [Vibrio profundi]|uniref:hypothetical protein n=1 Tax=Vibrio profundi TaxID=1774960 RepID=UPI0037367D1D